MNNFDVEVTYRTQLGGLTCQMSTSQRVATREEAEALRESVQYLPGLANAVVKIKNAPLPPTIDEAIDGFRKSIAEYPPIK